MWVTSLFIFVCIINWDYETTGYSCIYLMVTKLLFPICRSLFLCWFVPFTVFDSLMSAVCLMLVWGYMLMQYSVALLARITWRISECDCFSRFCGKSTYLLLEMCHVHVYLMDTASMCHRNLFYNYSPTQLPLWKLWLSLFFYCSSFMLYSYAVCLYCHQLVSSPWDFQLDDAPVIFLCIPY